MAMPASVVCEGRGGWSSPVRGGSHLFVTHGFPVAWPPVLDHCGGLGRVPDAIMRATRNVGRENGSHGASERAV